MMMLPDIILKVRRKKNCEICDVIIEICDVIIEIWGYWQ